MNKIKGFVLPFTMLISVLVLLVTSTSMTLLSKQFYFSKIYKQSQIAHYAADDALACALMIDDTYLGPDGLGIFPSNTNTDVMTYMNNVIGYVNSIRNSNGLPSIILTDIRCAQSPIFETGPGSFSEFSTSTSYYRYNYIDSITGLPAFELGITSIYNMHMDLGIIDPTDPLLIRHLFRCAKVTINKTASFRQVISQGYAQCDNPNGSVERAVVNTTSSI